MRFYALGGGPDIVTVSVNNKGRKSRK